MTSPPPLVDLTLPRSGSKLAHQVFSLALRRSMQELRKTLHEWSAQRGAAAWARPLRESVEAAVRERPAVVARVARDVGVSVWLRCLRDDGFDPQIAGPSLGIALALALAEVGALSMGVTIPGCGVTVTSVAARRWVRARSGERVGVGADGRVTIDGRPSPVGAPGFHSIEGSAAVLATIDGNPLWSREEHPDKSGNAADLGGRPVAEWTAMISSALALIAEFEPDLRREIELGLQQLVPVGYHESQHLSASFAEALGQAYLSLHPNPLTMAEAIIHEFSHNKLGAALELGPVLDNPWDEHPSPVRPDERPLHGVLLAAHAFVPVARLCERIRDSDHALANAAEQHLGRVIPTNLAAIDTLQARARWTEFGVPLAAELHAWARAHR